MPEYFAYGSNMSGAVMDEVCPGHRFVGRARLPEHRLAFTRRSVRTGTGVADIVGDPRGVVWGALYELAQEDLATLDEKEGAGWAYTPEMVRVYDDGGAAHDAVAYVVITKSSEEVPPSAAYAQGLLTVAVAERSVAMLRLVIESVPAAGDLGRATHEGGVRASLTRLAAFLERETHLGRMRVKEPAQAADLFYGMVISHHQMSRLLGAPSTLDDARIEEIAREAAHRFMRAYAR